MESSSVILGNQRWRSPATWLQRAVTAVRVNRTIVIVIFTCSSIFVWLWCASAASRAAWSPHPFHMDSAEQVAPSPPTVRPPTADADADADLGVPVLESSSPTNVLGSAVIAILTHDRLEYFPACLRSVLAARNADQFTIAVSMDSAANFDLFKAETAAVLDDGVDRSIEFWEHSIPTNGEEFPADAGITRHLKVLFDRAFETHDYVIVLEDDLVVSSDFFEFFQATGHLLPTSSGSGIYCVSAWNDQGLPRLVLDESKVIRTDFYPWLGFLLHKSFWVGAMEHEWPFWTASRWDYDWWLRLDSSLRSKSALIPEMPRIHHISQRGLHVGPSAASLYLGMPLASGKVRISADSTSIASDESKTRQAMLDVISSATKVMWEDIDQALIDHRGGSIVIHFYDNSVALEGTPMRGPEQLTRLLAKFNLFPDTYRSFFKRAFSFQLADGLTTVTLVGTSMADYWASG